MGKGSSFAFTIPYATSDEKQDTDILYGREISRPDRSRRDLRILLVEDNKLNVLVAQEELSNAFPTAQVVVATDGQRALDLLRTSTYDVILMDVQMPVMDGFEATSVPSVPLGGDSSRIPIVAMTANVMEAEVQQCKDAGMDGFIPKPFKQEELVAAIEQAIG